jgi:hypothetical protein
LVRPLEVGLNPEHRSSAPPEPRGELPIVSDLAGADHAVRLVRDPDLKDACSTVKYLMRLAAPTAAKIPTEIKPGPIVVDGSSGTGAGGALGTIGLKSAACASAVAAIAAEAKLDAKIMRRMIVPLVSVALSKANH